MTNLKIKAIEAFERETAAAKSLTEKERISSINAQTAYLGCELGRYLLFSDSEIEEIEFRFDAASNRVVCEIDGLLFSTVRGYLVAFADCPQCGVRDFERILSLADVGRLVSTVFRGCQTTFARRKNREPPEISDEQGQKFLLYSD